jgi:hypothetical protein
MQSAAGRKPTQSLKGSNVIFWNCASGVFNKKPMIEKYIEQFKPEVFFISECELGPNHMIELLNVPGYSIELANTFKSREKGRIMAYVANDSGFSRMQSLEHPLNDIIVLRKGNCSIIGLYAGFKTYDDETILSNFDRLLANVSSVSSKYRKIIVGGDFNADFSRENCPKKKSLELWQVKNAFDHLNFSKSTRLRLVAGVLQQSTIDHVFVKDMNVRDKQIIDTEVSDHALLIATFELFKKTDISNKKHVITDWRKFNGERLCAIVNEKIHDFPQTSSSPDVLNRELTSLLTVAMNRHRCKNERQFSFKLLVNR